ncbi:MAG TPA: LLM class flavin-dependent oxidoreductase [Thermoanaerobaculia bacterium]|nr:LLM class flavin-dependent oxidoreductase [Thermoanaerobaculia bacterium]
MSRQPLHLGTTPWVSDLAAAAAAISGQAETAEALGYESFWLPESHFQAPGACPSPLLLLAAAAARTSRIALGTTSYLLPIKNALQAAEEVAVLDRISGGRVILGLGRGFRPSLFAAFNVPQREKRDRFEATLAIMRRAWAGEPILGNGADLGGGEPFRLEPRPVQEPHPPLWVAAFGAKGVAQAGRLGLPYLASPVEPLSRLLANYRLHREALAEVGIRTELPVPVMRTVFVSSEVSALRRARAGLERQAAELRASTSAVLRGRAEGDLDDWALVGEPAHVLEAVERYREELGVTHLVVRGGIAGVDAAERLRSLETLASILR